MTSFTILIIGVPALLAAFAFKKAQKQTETPKVKRTPDWQFPPKWHPPVTKSETR